MNRKLELVVIAQIIYGLIFYFLYPMDDYIYNLLAYGHIIAGLWLILLGKSRNKFLTFGLILIGYFLVCKFVLLLMTLDSNHKYGQFLMCNGILMAINSLYLI